MKKWYQSKTIWVNVITAALAVVGELSGIFPVSQHPKVWATATTLLNVALRLITSQAISK